MFGRSAAFLVGTLCVSIFAACGGDDAPGKEQVVEESCADEGEPCECADGSKGENACASGETECECPEDGDDDAPGADKPDARGSSDGNDAGKRPPERDAGAAASRDSATNAPAAGDAGASAAGDASAPPPPPGPSGPVDGDPGAPMVSVPGLNCGAPTGRGVPPTVKIGGRDVVVVYPCAREGASVTFLFVLHGTLQEAQKFSFTLNAGPYHRLADSHNVIYVLPKAVGTQWGREDNGTDLPHLMEVVDWVYTTFGEKFKIRSMWAQGGSWGAFYLSNTFACDPRLEERLKGVRMVVGGGCPRCSNRLSCIVAQQELELGMGMMMTPAAREMAVDRANIATYATSKGCQGKMGPMDVGNTKHWVFPGCNPGWVYSYYMGPGEHAAPWDMPSVTKSMEEMKSIEQ